MGDSRRREAALMLDDSVSTPTVFPGSLPGVFHPGVPVALSDLALTESQAQALVDQGLPLALTKMLKREED